MKHQLRLSQINDHLSRNMNYYEVRDMIRDLQLYYVNVNQELLYEYVPVKLVACLQEYFRNIYKDFIDDPKYRKNVAKLEIFKDVTYDADVLAAFQEEDITLGEYISYLIPCSKFEDLNKSISTLAEVNFSKLLHEQANDCGEMLNYIQEIFSYRHIVCHEVPHLHTINKEMMEKWIDAASAFVVLTDIVVMDIKNPNPPGTTCEMLSYVQKTFDDAEKEFNSLIQTLQTSSHSDFESLSFDYLEKWKEFRKAKAESESKAFEGGSYYGIIYIDSFTRTTREMTKNLKVQYRHILKKNVCEKQIWNRLD